MKTKIKILHLEDTPADAELVERELKKGNFPFEKLVVASKTAFEKALKEFAPDIILADHTLPSFDSREAIKIITQKAIKIPFILVSATVSDEYAVEVMKAGADDYILKDRLHRLPQAVLNAMEKNRSESNLQTIFDNTSEGFILINSHGIVKAFNTKSAQTIFLNTELEIKIGSNVYDFIDPSRKENYKGILEKVFAGETIQYDYSFERINGDKKWFSFIINPAYNKSGEIEGACIATADITKRKEAEQELYESETFTQGVLSSLSSQIAVIDASGTLIAVNKAWDDFAIANGPVHLSDTSVGSNYFTVCKDAIASGENDARQTMDGILSVFKNEKQSFKLEYPCHSPEEERWFVLNVSPFGEDDTKVVISHQNITERKIAENELSNTSVELKKTVSELNIILDSSLDVICTINADGEFVNVSAASQQVWGYTPEELLGSKFMNLVYDEDADMTSKAAEKMVSGLQIPIFENRYVHKSGKVVPLLWSVNWDEKLQLMVCIAKDVTESKRLEKAIENERDQFFHMFLKAPSAIGKFKDANHVFEMANPLYLQLIGKKDIIGKTVAEVLPEVIEQGFVDILDNVYRTGESYAGKEMLAKVDKEENGELTDFYMNFVYQAYRNGEGEIEGIFFFINDITEQVLSKKKIEKSEKQYRQIVDTAQEGIWLLDENNRTTFVNRKMCEILEYTEEEMIGKAHFYFVDEDEKEKALIALERRKKGIAENYELDFISKSGKHVLTNISANPIFDEMSNFRGSLGMVSDITEKKHLEDLLEKSNRLAGIGSWEIDVVKGTVYWSDITKEIREAEPDFIPDLSTGIGFFTEGKNKKIISQRIQQCIDKGIPWDEELQLTTFKGNLKWVRTIGEAEFVNGKCSKVYGSFQDISFRKEAEQSLQQSQSNLKAILENTDASIYSLDTDLRYIAFNELLHNNLQQMYGLDIKIGDSVFDFLEKLDSAEANGWKAKYSKALKGETVKFEKEFSVDGLLTHQSFNIYPIWKNKTIAGFSCFVYDITTQKQEQLQKEKMSADIIQRNLDLEQFTYIVSHNLRAPAANIISCSEILQDEAITPQEQKELLQALSKSVTALDSVIRDINHILQVKSEVNEKKEVILFSELVNDIMLSVGNLIDKHHVRIRSDFSEVDEIYSLKLYIYSIFYNLITNSIKYRNPNKSTFIEIKSKKENGKIILTFKDNGLGIDMKAHSDKIFGLYKRFHSHVEGKGMGLYMVKTQVESLGGKISIASEPNKGTEFTIVFDT